VTRTQHKASRADGPPRILAVGPTPPPINGMSVATDHLLRSVVALDFELHNLDIADRRGLRNVGSLDLGNIVGALSSSARFLSALVRYRPDLVYVPVAQNALGFLRDSLFLLPTRLLGLPLVVHIHGSTFGRFYSEAWQPMRWFVRHLLRGRVRVVVLSEGLRAIVDGIVEPSSVVVVPNGIDDFAGGLSHSSAGSPPVVLFLSTLRKEKGVLDMVRAAALVHDAVPMAEFVFAGEWTDDGDRRLAEKLAQDAGMTDQVRFLGVISPPEKWDLFMEADVFALPSWAEGQPYSILEAMCAGVPVVASDVGAVSETVVDGVTGRIVAPHDVDALAVALLDLLTDQVVRVRMGTCGRKRYLERYTAERWGQDMVSVFREAIYAGSDQCTGGNA